MDFFSSSSRYRTFTLAARAAFHICLHRRRVTKRQLFARWIPRNSIHDRSATRVTNTEQPSTVKISRHEGETMLLSRFRWESLRGTPTSLPLSISFLLCQCYQFIARTCFVCTCVLLEHVVLPIEPSCSSSNRGSVLRFDSLTETRH